MTAALARLSLLAVLLSACGRKDADDAAPPVTAVVSARTGVVAMQPFTETVGTIGTAAGRPGHMAVLGAPVAARITRVAVAVGQPVQRGAVLVVLDQTTFVAAAQAATATLVAAERTFERTRRLVSEGIAPRKDLEQAAAALAQARATAATTRREQELSVLRAPITGVVTRLSASLGEEADPTRALVEVADPRAIDLYFSVSPAQAARVRPGAHVSLSAGQGAGAEPLGVATVRDVSATVDSATRTVAVRAQAATTRRPIRIGETVFGHITVATRPRAIVVPLEALVPAGEEYHVFVVDASGIAHQRAVTVGGRTDKVAEISEGLLAGERIVTSGAYGLEDSVRVRP